MVDRVRRVLVADDNPEIRSLLARLVQREFGVCPHVARDGGEALFCLEEADYRFDLVIVDVDMPRASGFFVLTAVDSIRPEVPVVVISGNTQHSKLAMECGASVFLAKPFMLAHMARVLHSVVPAAPVAQEAPVAQLA